MSTICRTHLQHRQYKCIKFIFCGPSSILFLNSTEYCWKVSRYYKHEINMCWSRFPDTNTTPPPLLPYPTWLPNSFQTSLVWIYQLQPPFHSPVGFKSLGQAIYNTAFKITRHFIVNVFPAHHWKSRPSLKVPPTKAVIHEEIRTAPIYMYTIPTRWRGSVQNFGFCNSVLILHSSLCWYHMKLTFWNVVKVKQFSPWWIRSTEFAIPG